MSVKSLRQTVQGLLPSLTPVRFVAEDGTPVARPPAAYAEPPVEILREAHRRMVLGRRFDTQATALTKQGRLAVYPSSRGQEACQVGAALALRPDDWLFPTYRDSVALVTRGIDPVEVLTLLRGEWHCGYDPAATRTAPQCTPLATQVLHATGMAESLRRKGEDGVAMALVGDGATSEGDFHEALNFAAVFRAPVVFLVQNNKYAISVPLARQTAAPALAYKGVGHGMRSEQVDGNDPVAVLAVLTEAVAHARAGHGPFLVEAHTYRMDAHTNADDATRYRDADEVERWRAADPLIRLETYLRARGALTDQDIAAVGEEAEELAAELRAGMNAETVGDPLELFDHVYAELTPQLREQRALLAAELAETAESAALAEIATPYAQED
ncbi:PROBABLE PYRUVATE DEHYDROGENASE E1 COMPONENT (ALPHA SUBUNIT) PDHA (PYRUVATE DECARBOXYLASE) (PYRUVATE DEHYDROGENASE) (PYRUVIC DEHYDROGENASE) [Streptomyces scabiei 87.22]|uniref:PROBABLE PYRUVATE DEHYDROGENASE E1 COMPONENT (ALPHA SUBUNIT) PDHA (PYRUVATE DECARBOXYLASE) (PYRUVATE DEHYDROGENASE) (PYRUVIC DEHYDROGENASE) n=1 Tax=Streptomyces scabiei (strain 87.22) TaxID=680198 RepID=C9Z4T3_STRSW|nr:pyruvate dehydrogenase (acetyl-transferring) E1 component subunit alpha [Streptomyces scabiei]MDX2653270.1 pyruvate dehydrogenase (acetyl-transferring) E1 component subunit alpha [Streptomyces scabiei]MDX2726581.1 pyruvate dehydrogenase (acetyl-transferring) E1 component subunit alpha [Streptomyces scabiei]MDX2871625.1 pyruvate dehydrogenase (acetyl-transferring) E1 component subunit alpha [Streptomyces scabiei]MDX2883967.1 pyruvate dehydrogenase (acetyl-transferring) E1 component subunit al